MFLSGGLVGISTIPCLKLLFAPGLLLIVIEWELLNLILPYGAETRRGNKKRVQCNNLALVQEYHYSI